jgi:hypothetical protein
VGLYKLANPVATHSLKSPGFQPLNLKSGKKLVQAFAFIKFVNLYRCNEGVARTLRSRAAADAGGVRRRRRRYVLGRRGVRRTRRIVGCGEDAGLGGGGGLALCDCLLIVYPVLLRRARVVYRVHFKRFAVTVCS